MSLSWDYDHALIRCAFGAADLSREHFNIEHPHAITNLLDRWRAGDRAAEAQLVELIYPMLRQMAGGQIKHRTDQLTLSATELAHEAFIRLREQQAVQWRNRAQFFALVSTQVRRVVIDYLRERFADKRGGGKLFVDVLSSQDASLLDDSLAFDWVALDQALGKLEALDPACAKVVQLKLFTPLNAEEIAEACAVSEATIGRQWRFARTWLAKELESGAIDDAS
jgi:RNA polymerase sigma factor (TIGR02999 family)